MKNKVLKLCKRFNKITLNEILPLLGATEEEIQPILDELLAVGLISKRSDETYFYVEPTSNKPQLPLFFEYRTKEELDLIIKCFCVGLTSFKTSVITEVTDNIVLKFNKYFRKMIYEKQLNELQKYYKDKPYTPRIRNVLGQTVYFYYYNNRTYISENKLKSRKQEEFLPKQDDKLFRMDYLKLTRRICHNYMHNNITHYLAEYLLRLNDKNEHIPIDDLIAHLQ